MTPVQRAALIEDLVNSKFLILAGMQGQGMIDAWLKTFDHPGAQRIRSVLKTFHQELHRTLRATQRRYAEIYPGCDVKKDFQVAIWGENPFEETDKNPTLLRQDTPCASAVDEGARLSGLVSCYNKEEWMQNDPLNTKAFEQSLAQQKAMSAPEKQRRRKRFAEQNDAFRTRRRPEAESLLDTFLIKYADSIGEFLLTHVSKLPKIAESYQKALYQKIAAYRTAPEEKMSPAPAPGKMASPPEVETETDVATDPEEETASIAQRVKFFRKGTGNDFFRARALSFFKTASSAHDPSACAGSAPATPAKASTKSIHPLPTVSLKRTQSEPAHSAAANATKKSRALPSFLQTEQAAAQERQPVAPMSKEDKELMDFLISVAIDPFSALPRP